MVMGIFVAVLLIGMIYYVWGIGDAIAFRERMQDASDTAAFSAAVIHARGMNMLALLNMIMAAAAMVAAIIQTAAHMLMWATAFATLECAGCGPWCGSCCEACPYAVIYGIDAANTQSTADDVNDAVTSLMNALHGYAEGIRSGVPVAAQAKVMAYGTDVYRPVTNFGMMAPLRSSMPAEDDDSNWPCDNKVLPTVAILAPVYAYLNASASSWHLYAGIAMGDAVNARPNSRDWCDGDPKTFQRVTDHEMGSDAYQVQAYMMGDHDLEWTQEGVSVATWGQGEDEGRNYTQLARMGNISFAQAEFFYDDDEPDWHEWLWHMNWRARLRRWRLNAAGGVGGVLGACSGGGCGELGSMVGTAQNSVVH